MKRKLREEKKKSKGRRAEDRVNLGKSRAFGLTPERRVGELKKKEDPAKFGMKLSRRPVMCPEVNTSGKRRWHSTGRVGNAKKREKGRTENTKKNRRNRVLRKVASKSLLCRALRAHSRISQERREGQGRLGKPISRQGLEA